MEDGWINIFEYLTSAAAAILGLSFVAFSFKPDYRKETGLRYMAAVVSLVELAIPLFFGLIFLAPDHPWITGGRVVGVAGYMIIVAQLAVASRYVFREDKKFELVDKLQICIGVAHDCHDVQLDALVVVTHREGVHLRAVDLFGPTEAWLSLHLPGREVPEGVERCLNLGPIGCRAWRRS